MAIVIYADFSCPYSYLASLRVDRLLWSGAAEIDWRAIQRHPRLPGPPPGSPQPAGCDERGRDLAVVAAHARPDEQVPHPPAGPVDVEATGAAYAEAVAEGAQDQLRRRLFTAIWTQGRRVSTVYEVRQLIAEVMCPPEPIWPRLNSPDLPGALLHDPDVNRVIRRSGGTVTVYGGPLTGAGSRRVRQWQQEWLALPGRATPVVIAPGGTVLQRAVALHYLAALASVGTPSPPVLPRPGLLPRGQRRAAAGIPPGGLPARR
jgi:hypothetical protein